MYALLLPSGSSTILSEFGALERRIFRPSPLSSPILCEARNYVFHGRSSHRYGTFLLERPNSRWLHTPNPIIRRHSLTFRLLLGGMFVSVVHFDANKTKLIMCASCLGSFPASVTQDRASVKLYYHVTPDTPCLLGTLAEAFITSDNESQRENNVFINQASN